MSKRSSLLAALLGTSFIFILSCCSAVVPGQPLDLGGAESVQATDELPGTATSYRWKLCGLDWGPVSNLQESPKRQQTSFGAADPERGIFIYETYNLDRDRHQARRVDDNGSFSASISVKPTDEQAPPGWFELPDLTEVSWISQEQKDFLASDAVPAPHAHELRHLSGVTKTFALDGLIPVNMSDRFGAFERYEMLPSTTFVPLQQMVPLAAQLMRQPQSHGTWLLDVWSDETGVVQRLRVQTKETKKSWYELRFTVGLAVELLPGPDGPETLPEVELCPDDNAQAQASDWAGFEDWEPSFLSPIGVSVDPEGRAYDIDYRPGDFTFEHVGQMSVTNSELHVLNAYAFSNGLTEHDAVSVFKLDDDAIQASGNMLDISVATISWHELHMRSVGVRFDTANTEVELWTSFSTVACEIVTAPVVTAEHHLLFGERPAGLRPEVESDWELIDIDEDGVIDSFGAPFAPTCASATVGLNADGAAVSFVLWYGEVPWRLGIPDGIPPPEVTKAEQAYQDCLDRTTPTYPGGWCEVITGY